MQSYKGISQKVAGVGVVTNRKVTVFGKILNKSVTTFARKLGKSESWVEGGQSKIKTDNSGSSDTGKLGIGKFNNSSYGQGSQSFRIDTPSTRAFKTGKSNTDREHENECRRTAWHHKKNVSRDKLLERIKTTHQERKNEAYNGFKRQMESHLVGITESFVSLEHEYENAQRIKLLVHKANKKTTQQSFVMQDNGQNCSRLKLKKSDKFFKSFFMPEDGRQKRKSTYNITPKRIIIALNMMAKGYVGPELEKPKPKKTKV